LLRDKASGEQLPLCQHLASFDIEEYSTYPCHKTGIVIEAQGTTFNSSCPYTKTDGNRCKGKKYNNENQKLNTFCIISQKHLGVSYLITPLKDK